MQVAIIFIFVCFLKNIRPVRYFQLWSLDLSNKAAGTVETTAG
jgi:hypothetical protein